MIDSNTITFLKENIRIGRNDHYYYLICVSIKSKYNDIRKYFRERCKISIEKETCIDDAHPIDNTTTRMAPREMLIYASNCRSTIMASYSTTAARNPKRNPMKALAFR